MGASPPLRERAFYFAHFVYRIYDVDGRLLYVGSTRDIRERIRSHLSTKRWWWEVADIRVDVYPNRSLGEDAEQRAIAEENPRENVVRVSVPTEIEVVAQAQESAQRDAGHGYLPGSDRFRLLAALGTFRSGATRESIARRADMDPARVGAPARRTARSWRSPSTGGDHVVEGQQVCRVAKYHRG